MTRDSTNLPQLDSPRARALIAGEDTYEAGPCVHGHEAPRRAADGRCTACADDSEPQAISRNRARELGLKRYYNGPCRRNHVSERYVSSGECIACSKAWARGELKGEFGKGRPTGIPDARQEALAERIDATLRELRLLEPGRSYDPVELLAIISLKAYKDDNLQLAATAAAQAAKYIRPQLAAVRLEADLNAHVEIDHGAADIFARVVSAETEKAITAQYCIVDDSDDAEPAK